MKRAEQYIWFNSSLSSMLHWMVMERIPFRIGEVHRPNILVRIYSTGIDIINKGIKLFSKKVGSSLTKHPYSLAVDIWITDASGLNILWKDPRYALIGQYWKALGGTWGGDFKGKTAGDVYHFEISEKVSKI
jgi:hypothetical protein